MASVNTGANADNVVEFRPQGARRIHGLDPLLAEYIADMNKAMIQTAGISYTNIRTSLHGEGFDAVRWYMDNGKEAHEAVNEIVRDHRLRRIGNGVSSDEAASYNKVQAAIAEFVVSDANRSHPAGADEVEQVREWRRTADGLVVNPLEEAVAFMSPVRKKPDGPNEPASFGFGIVVYEGLEYDGLEGRVSGYPSGEAYPIGRFDLADALESFDNYVADRTSKRNFTF